MTTTEEFLEHYGVKGMKWGVRRDKRKTVTKAQKKKFKRDRKVYSRMSVGEAAVATILGGPTATVGYKAGKIAGANARVTAKKNKSLSLNEAKKVSVGEAAVSLMLGGPTATIAYWVGKENA